MSLRRRLWYSTFVLIVSLPLCVHAQSSWAAAPSPVAEALAQAAAHPPEPTAVVAAGHDRLLSSTKKLEELLASGPSEIRRSWNDFLDLPRLKTELARQEPDVSALRAITERISENRKGLDLAEFLAVRRALRAYFTAREYAAAPHPQALFLKRIGELRESLSRLDGSFEEVAAHRAGKLVDWLEPLGPEGAGIADAARSQYCRVNALAVVSGRAANLLLERKVEEHNFIADMILGTYTQGEAHVSAQVSVGVLPSPRHSCLELRVNGLINAPNTTAQRRNVTVYSSSQTSLAASKQVLLDDQGLQFLPATAAAASSAQLQGVDASRRFVERIAWRRATRILPEAEQLVSRRAETESSSKLDEQAANMLEGLNETICEQLRGPMLRMNAFPVTQFSSTADHLRIQLSQWNPSQLAPAAPVPSLAAEYDLACAAHESMVNNLTESLLGGQTIRDEAWRDILEVMTGETPRPLWVHERSERWSMTLQKERPLLAHFDKGRAGLTLRLAKLNRGQRQFEHPLEIAAQFRLQVGQDGPFLIRDGDLEIKFSSGLPTDEAAELRKFLAHKMGAVFPEELHFDGFVPPAGGTLGRLRSLQAAEFDSHDGWLTLGYKIAQPSTRTEVAGK